MLDVKNPEIDVDQIMQQVQEKVRLRRAVTSAPPTVAPPVAANTTQGEWSMTHELLARARETSQIGAALPPMSRISGIKRALAVAVAKVFLRIAQLITRDQRAFNQAVLDVFHHLDGRLLKIHSELETRIAQEAAARATVQGEVTGLGAEFTGLRKEMAGLRELAAAPREIAALRAELETRSAALQQDLANGRQSETVRLGHVRTAISLQERRLTLLLEEARRRLPKTMEEKELQAFADELPHLTDAAFLAFEDEFRGSRDEIKGRLMVYLPRFKDAGAGTEKAPILDVGCGRGELLEICRSEGLVASGVDSNRAAVDLCVERGLHATVGDLFEKLRSFPDGSLGALTAIHVVEHLPFPLVLKLLDESLRVLRSGGVAILETPNPKNVLVGASNFYIDPTHRNPVHPQTLHYLAEWRGLIRVETLMLHPLPKEMRIPGDSPIASAFNEYFYGAQDYALLGYRP